MPIVPMQTTPTVGFDPGREQVFAAPNTENYAGKQLEAQGQATAKLGGVMGEIATRMQADLDDAVTKSADTAFAAEAEKILLNKDDGYLTTAVGKNAQDRHQDTLTRLAEARKAAEERLGNDVQRHMFSQVADKHLVAWTGQIDTHAAQQTRVYAAGESDAREKQYISMAINSHGNPSMFNRYLQTAKSEADAKADLLQYSPDSAQRAQLKSAVTGKISAGVVSNLVMADKFLDAKSFLDKAVKDESIDANTALELYKHIDVGVKKETAIDTADRVMATSQLPSGTDFDSLFAWTIKHHEGTTLVQNDGGKGQTKFGVNKTAHPDVDIENLTLDGAKKIYRQYWDAIDADNLSPQMRAIAFDAAVNQGIPTAKKMLKEANGDVDKMVALRLGRYEEIAAADKTGRFTPADIQSWKNRVAKAAAVGKGESTSLSGMEAQIRADIPDRETADMAVSHLKSRFSEEHAAKQADYQARKTQAQDIAWSPDGKTDWKNVPPALMASLTPQDQAQLREKPRGDDPSTVLMLDKHPELWVDGKLQNYRGLLSEGTYRRYAAEGSKPEKRYSATIDSEVFHQTLAEAGMNNLLNPAKGSQEELEVFALREKYKFVMESASIKKKGELDLDEKKALMQSVVKPVKARLLRTGLGESILQAISFGTRDQYGVEDRRAYQMEDRRDIIIPKATKDFILQQYEAAGITKYTEDDILQSYLLLPEAKKR